jgi:hypothetical protein
MDINTKTIGTLLIGISIVLIIVLSFIKIDLDERNLFLCEQFQNSDLDMASCPAHNDGISWTITLAFGLSFLILGMGTYMRFFHKESKGFKQVDLSKLDEEEKQVYDLVKSKDGSAYQSDIVKETGLSKVKTTRILDKLETNGILERKRRGMTNIVVLK